MIVAGYPEVDLEDLVAAAKEGGERPAGPVEAQAERRVEGRLDVAHEQRLLEDGCAAAEGVQSEEKDRTSRRPWTSLQAEASQQTRGLVRGEGPCML